MRHKHFLIVICHSSLVKAAMNGAHVCKLRNGVKKTPTFLLFLLAKGSMPSMGKCAVRLTPL
jgi:hypothetical protein